MDEKNFYERLVKLRPNFTPTELAEKIDIPRSSVYQWARGSEPKLSTLVQVSVNLNLSFTEILYLLGLKKCRSNRHNKGER